MAEDTTLGQRLTTALKAKGLNNLQLAKAVGVHHVTVSAWRNDKKTPNDETLARVANVLGVSVPFLRYGTVQLSGTAIGTPAVARGQLSVREGPISLSGAPAVAHAVAMPGQIDMAKLPVLLPQAVNAALHAYMPQISERGLDATVVLRLLTDFAYSALFPDAGDEERVRLLDIQWEAISRALLGPTGQHQTPGREIPERPAEAPPERTAAGRGGSGAPTARQGPTRRKPKDSP